MGERHDAPRERVPASKRSTRVRWAVYIVEGAIDVGTTDSQREQRELSEPSRMPSCTVHAVTCRTACQLIRL